MRGGLNWRMTIRKNGKQGWTPYRPYIPYRPVKKPMMVKSAVSPNQKWAQHSKGTFKGKWYRKVKAEKEITKAPSITRKKKLQDLQLLQRKNAISSMKPDDIQISSSSSKSSAASAASSSSNRSKASLTGYEYDIE
jgi:acyl-homoserine lactone acylase PvdQ